MLFVGNGITWEQLDLFLGKETLKKDQGKFENLGKLKVLFSIAFGPGQRVSDQLDLKEETEVSEH